MNRLDISPNGITLTVGCRQHVLATDLAALAKQLSPYPPNDAQWEMAIMQVEDAIMPFSDGLKNEKQTLVAHADMLAVLPHTQTGGGAVIGRDTLELAFVVSAGLRRSHELPDMPQTAQFAALLLLLREWVHHMGIDEVILVKS
ncbi:hypothetical protein [Neisseria sp.]|uniref:hypothetical protein n=1 Tax=Neisseria sp. TaxID=192066 RepID=UPI0026DCAA0B|nr:hypothetical protein [Neisseria sp.]MDO4226303.1 hypothetical protein [Neisseria sp.]